jgi:hypothetical protein
MSLFYCLHAISGDGNLFLKEYTLGDNDLFDVAIVILDHVSNLRLANISFAYITFGRLYKHAWSDFLLIGGMFVWHLDLLT